MTSPPNSIAISIVSHTNAGKTTLARTLLGRDVGTVRDAPHVTEFADVYTMLETSSGEQLLLWDTPGFGDSLRLVKRLRESGSPLGWFMSQVWDRWRDRAFWSSQQAMRNVREHADVMLYLVNAAESPESAGYVQPEMELLGWIDKPVIVLLNQLGAPREGALEAAEVERWRRHLAHHAQVKAVLPLDAFARCWVQEITLLRAIETALVALSPSDGNSDASRSALMARLREAWLAERLQTFDSAMRSIAGSLARLAGAYEVVPDRRNLMSRMRQAGAAIGLGNADQTPTALAQKALAAKLDAEVRANTLELIQLHGLEGNAQTEILERVATHFDTRLRMDEGKAALWGGVVSGALVGLKADILSGGLTMGGGLLAGGLIGALGAAGLARCVNLVRGTDRSWVAWNAQALDQMLEAALLRYLAVAHFGRGRGEWVQGESPPHWRDVVERALQLQREALEVVWQERDAGAGASVASTLATSTSASASASGATAVDSQQLITAALTTVVTQAASDALRALYPDAASFSVSASASAPAAMLPVGESAQPAPVPPQ